MDRKQGDLRAPIVIKIDRRSSLNWIRVAILLLLDSLMLSLAWLIADKLGTPVDGFHLLWSHQKPFGMILPILAIALGILSASGLYGTDDQRRNFPSLIKALTLVHLILPLVYFLSSPNQVLVSRSVFLLGWFLSLIFVFSERLLLHLAIVNLRSKNSALRDKIFLMGNAEDIEKTKQIVERSQQFNIIGTADLSLRENRLQWIETLEKLRQQNISEIFICSWQDIKDPIILFWELKSAGIRLRVLPVSLDLPRQWSEIKLIGRVTTIRFSSAPIIGADYWLKRSFDLAASSLILLIFGIPMLIVAIAIKLDSPGPIFFRQTRIGLKGREFKVWKFRTMVQNASELQKHLEAKNEVQGGVLFKMKDDPRITKIGRVLRRYSLDELPQLFNVLAGQMSLVGPRPLPVRDVERLAEHYLLRHEVLPGITGLWQVGGRSNVDCDEVFYLDVAYIQHWSLALDFKILLQTIKVVLTKEGAY